MKLNKESDVRVLTLAATTGIATPSKAAYVNVHQPGQKTESEGGRNRGVLELKGARALRNSS